MQHATSRRWDKAKEEHDNGENGKDRRDEACIINTAELIR